MPNALRHLVGRAGSGAPAGHERVEEARRIEAAVVLIRWVAVALAALLVTIYSGAPYPPGLQLVGYGLTGALAAGNILLWAASRRVTTAGVARRVGVLALTFDIAIAVAFVWLFTFDPGSALFTVLFVVTAEGALRFRLVGAVGTWAVVTVLYVAREVFGRWAYGHPLTLERLIFRMGMLLVVALIVGLMAETLARQRRDLADALEELRRTDAWRSMLITTLAHDVRSPLGSALTALQVLEVPPAPGRPDRSRELMALVRRQIRHTLLLSDDLLELARLERGQVVLEPAEVPVREAAQRAVDLVGTGDDVEVRVDPDLRAVLDRARFQQIVVNLVGNAVKHGRPPVTVSADASDGVVTLRVHDCGDGVPAGQDLFEPFARGAQAGSVGLGLWVVGELARLHGGDASHHDEGSGTTFVVRLRELRRGEGERVG